MNQNNERDISGKEAYEAKKALKDKDRSKEQRAVTVSGTSRKVLIIVIVLVVIVLAVYGLFILAQKSGPQGEDFSRAVPMTDNSNAHISLDADLPVYTSDPPTSGPHYGDPARTGFRGDAGLPDGHFIHSMEHGNIWVSYSPSLSEAVVDDLEKIAGNRVVVSMRGANESDIVLAAWGRIDTFDVGGELTDADKQRIRDFILRYTDRGPEQLPPTAHSQGI